MTAREAMAYAKARLLEAGFAPETASSEARQLLGWLLGEGTAFWQRIDKEISADTLARLEDALHRRSRREPLQLIMGDVIFFGLRLEVLPGVLVPRPETELLVERALDLLGDSQRPLVLDVGTGSGAIALAIKHQRRDARVYASDVSAAALGLASRNAAALGLGIVLLHAPLTAGLKGCDLIVSNPPYLPNSDAAAAPAELAWEAPEALYAGERGLDVAAALLEEAPAALREGGKILLELDPRNVGAAAELAVGLGYRNVRIEADMAGRPRYLSARRG